MITQEMRRILGEFSLFTDWEDKYAYLIDLGKKLPPMNERYKTNAYKVAGCTSQVWMVAVKADGIIRFYANSDAYIVGGLIALLLRIYSGKTQKEIEAINIRLFFEDLGLRKHLSANRSNGFFAMVERIKELANK